MYREELTSGTTINIELVRGIVAAVALIALAGICVIRKVKVQRYGTILKKGNGKNDVLYK